MIVLVCRHGPRLILARPGPNNVKQSQQKWKRNSNLEEVYPFTTKNVVILQLGPSTSVPNAADARPNDFHGLPVGGGDVRNSSNSFALRWRAFSSEVEKLKWFCYDHALKLAL